MAQWKRAGPITQRSVDRNHALLNTFLYSRCHVCVRQELGLLPVLPGEEEEGGVDDVWRVRKEVLVDLNLNGAFSVHFCRL